MFRELLRVIRGKQSPRKRLRHRVRSPTPRRLARQQCDEQRRRSGNAPAFLASFVNLKMQARSSIAGGLTMINGVSYSGKACD